MPEKEESKTTNIMTDIAIAVIALLVALAVLGTYLGDIVGWYRSFIDRFYSKNWQKFFVPLKIILGVLDIFLIGFIIFVLKRHAALVKRPPEEKIVAHAAIPREEIKRAWEHIRELANSSSPSDWNMAILRADALLDDVLQRLEYEGTTLAERLKIMDPTKLSSLESVWSAHRLRNMIAHDPLEQHTKETIIHALRSYEQALKELGMMEEKT